MSDVIDIKKFIKPKKKNCLSAESFIRVVNFVEDLDRYKADEGVQDILKYLNTIIDLSVSQDLDDDNT